MEALEYFKSKKKLCDSIEDCLDCPIHNLPLDGKKYRNTTFDCVESEMECTEEVLKIVTEFINKENARNNE